MILHVLFTLLFIGLVGGDRWDCPPCGGGPANSPGGAALDDCAKLCLQAAPTGAGCANNPSSDCICNGAHYPGAVQAIASCAMASCPIVQDLAAVTMVASSWCEAWSRTAAPYLVTPYTGIATSSGNPSTGIVTPTVSPTPTYVSTIATSAQPSPTLSSGDTSNLYKLLECTPCGRSKCSFTVNPGGSNAIFGLIVGSPVSNCQQGSTLPVTSTSGGSITIADTWSESVTIGLDLGELAIESTNGWSSTKSMTYSQMISIQVPPGQIGVLVANIQYNQINGTMEIGNGQQFPLISNQPLGVLNYGPQMVPCGSQFTANASSTFNCTSRLQMGLKENVPSTSSLVSVIGLVSFLISLLQ